MLIKAEVLETFATSLQDFVEIALRGAIRKVGKPLHHLNRQDINAIIGMLEQAEVFRFSQSVEIVMEQLGISRASIYASRCLSIAAFQWYSYVCPSAPRDGDR